MKNPYEVLGLNMKASPDEIKASYKKQALKHHPDRGGDEVIFKEMTEAYSILSDPQKKNNFDKFGSVDNSGININDIINNMFGGFDGLNVDDIINDVNNQQPSFTSFSSKPRVFIKVQRMNHSPQNAFGNVFNLNNIFEDLLNEDMLNGGLHTPQNSPNLQATPPQQYPPNKELYKKNTIPKYDDINVNVTLDELISASKKKIKFTITDLCEICRNFMINCLTCNGTSVNCYSCNGKGIIITNKDCIKCTNGLCKKDIDINIQIPKGVPENHIFQLKNKGSYNMETQSYNHLKLKIKYAIPKNIQVHGNAIFLYIDLKMEELLCGFTKKVKFGDTEFDINIKHYFNPTEPLIYEKMGIPTYKDDKIIGDLIVKFNVIYPDTNNSTMKKYQKVFNKIFY